MILLSTAYLAPVSYYALLMHGKEVWIEAHENFQKQSYRNRCIVGSDQGPQTLSVNVVSANSRQRISDIALSDHADWQHHHQEALATNYGNSPFYEYYIDDLVEVLMHGHDGTLFSLNEALRRKICELIGIEDRVRYTEEYVSPIEAEGLVNATGLTNVTSLAKAEGLTNAPSLNDASAFIDLRNTLHPKKPIALAVPQFCPVPYYQISGVGGKQPFMPDLCILDLLFNMGPESILVLRDSLVL